MIDWVGLFFSIAAIVLLVVRTGIIRFLCAEPNLLSSLQDTFIPRWFYHLLEQRSIDRHARRGSIRDTHLPRHRGKVRISAHYAT